MKNGGYFSEMPYIEQCILKTDYIIVAKFISEKMWPLPIFSKIIISLAKICFSHSHKLVKNTY